MREFKIYHFNWTTKATKTELLKQMENQDEEQFDSIMASSAEKAVKFYIKEHGLPSNDQALIGIKGLSVFIASTNKNRTCSVSQFQ
jgi:hypothetical protein